MSFRALVQVPILVIAASAGAPWAGDSAAEAPPFTEDEFETILRLRAAVAVLEGVEQAGRATPAFEKTFRSVDGRFLQELEPAARELLPQKDAWGTRLQVVQHGGDWVAVSAGPDGEFQMTRFLETVIATGETPAGQMDFADDLAVGGHELITQRRVERGPQKRTMADVRSIATAIESYSVDFGRYPCPRDGVVPLEEMREVLEPVYIKRLPTTDGWGTPILFSCSSAGYGLVSYGSDRQPDTNYIGAGPGLSALPARGAAADTAADMVFRDGQFIAWPESTTP